MQAQSGVLDRIAQDRVEVLMRAYSGALALVAVLLAVATVSGGGSLPEPWAVLALASLAALAERGSVRLSSTLEASVSLLATVFAAVLFGPVAGMLVGAASMAGDLRPPYMRWLTYTASRSVTGGLAGLAAASAASFVDTRAGEIAAAALAGAVVAEVFDITFTSITLHLRRGDNLRSTISTLAPANLASLPIYVPLIAVLTLAYRDISTWTLPLFCVPAIAAHRLFVLYERQRQLADDLIAVNDDLQRANLSFAGALVATLDARDRYTAGHSAAVAIYARDIAARMGLSDDQQRLVHLCGLVHDIGKIGLPPGLLEKPGALTLEERREMERHSEIGERILAKVENYAEIARIVRHHHERVDGNGYPDGLAGEEIPLLSRIIAVADAYNAMTSDRPYRDAMPSRVARMRLAQAVESQFDTSVAAAFEAVLTGADDEYRVGIRFDFDLEAREADAPRLASELRAVEVA
jgi:putative nucleotidyltransferase with HDIG domain